MKHFRQKLLNTFQSFLTVTLIAATTVTHADDTEVFSTVNIANNMLFVLDVSGSMNNKVVTVTHQDGTTTSSGGVETKYDYPVNSSADDAWQDFADIDPGNTQEVQDPSGNKLEFKPGNVVATRFSFPRYSILRKGYYSQSYFVPGYGWVDIQIKKVKIKNAYLKFKAVESNAENTKIKVSIENIAAQGADQIYQGNTWYHESSYYNNAFTKIKLRQYAGNKTWYPNAWNNNSSYTTLDVSSLINKVVNRSDWDESIGGWKKYLSSLAFKFKTKKGKRVASSFEGGFAPELHIEKIRYKITYHYYDWWGNYRTKNKEVSPSQINFWNKDKWSWEDAKSSLSTHAKYGFDDAVQGSASVVATTSYTDSQHTFNQNKVVGLRFDLNANPIPQGSVISRAYLQFTAANNSNKKATINIQVEDSGAPVDFATNPDIKGRTWENDPNGTQYDWDLTISEPWLSGEKAFNERTGDLKKMLQFVVDKSDWGNVVAFRLFGVLGDRIAQAQDSGNPPELHVEFQDISGTTVTVPGGGATTTRVERRIVLLKEALREVLKSAPNVNVGLMKYSGMKEHNRDHYEDKRNHFVGGVLFPVSPIYEKAKDYIGTFSSRDNLPDPGEKSVRDYVADVADQWEPEGGTPIVDALYEAALYYRGEKMHFGKNKNNGGDAFYSPGSNPSTYFGGAEIDDRVNDVGRSSIANANYISPIKNECQSNYIVLMSDGAPTYYYSNSPNGWGNDEGQFASTLKGTSDSELAQAIPSCQIGNGETGNNGVKLNPGTCGREITQYLATHDQMPDTTGSRGQNEGVKEEQTVKTFTIGFGQGLEDGAEEYLRSLATVDGQGYYTADNKEELKNAFQNIFDTVAKAKGSLSSPGYSVNVKSGLEHEKDIYIPVFDRKNTSRWSGNLKKFKLVNDQGKRKIRGSNGKDAVDELGGFTEESKDYWSNNTTPDGLDIQKGGAAELIDPEGRVVYTNAGCTHNCDLTANKLEVSNTAISSALLGIDNLGLSDQSKASRRKRLIYFAQGWEQGFYDANSNPHGAKRHYMGDMLHSEPMVVTYKKGSGEQEVGKKQYIFAATNEGYLHAFDTSTGKEKFAFMPAELLKNQESLLNNTGTYRDHKYGVDGVMTYWHNDENKNKEVDEGETVYLYFGLRRGGRSYYALDITDMDSPKLLWSVTGSGDIDTTPNNPWASLGQTWSAPYLARVGLSDGTRREVVMFTGGYDPVEDRDKAGGRNELDSSTKSVSPKMGNNIFIVDAKTGVRLWSLRESMGDTTSLKYSIPGGFRMLDVNRNGLVDRLYFADTGGYVWRLDLSEKLALNNDTKSKLEEFAYLSGSGANSRKFYNEPDVSMLRPNGKTIFAVSIGSGFRAHPNDKVIEDKMFILRDESPYQPLPDDYEKIVLDNLASVSVSTSNDVISLTHSGFGDAGKDKGWFLSLPDGEKVLAQAITFDGIITFTTMVPQILTHNVDPCKAPKAFGRLYALNILTGKPVIDLDEDDQVDDDDTYIDVVKGEIPGKPQIIFNKFTKKVISTDADTGDVTKTSCSHPVDIRVGKKRSQVTGYDACRLESVYWNDPQPDNAD